jgi:CHAT domain-containing protein/tetratricopeptide (TPR) repeat protein
MRRLEALLLMAGCAAAGCSKLRAAPDELDALMLRGDSAYADAEFAAARTLWRSALPEATKAGDTAREARLLTSIGLAAWRLGEYSEARSIGERALALKLTARLEPDLFKSYNALGLLANDEGRLDDALTLYQSAANAARATGDHISLAKSANNIALVQVARGQFVQARAGYLEAIRVGRLAGQALIEGRAQSNLAALDIQLGDPGSALQAVRRALLILRAIGDRAGEQNALGQLGTAYDMLGEPRRALAAFDSALQLSREQGLQQEEASNLELLAGVYRQAGDLQRALDLFEAANRLNLRLGLAVEQGANRRNSAEIHARMGRTDLARAAALAARSLHRSAGVPVEELRDLLLLAELASLGARETEAAAYLKAAEALSLRLDARIARVELALARATLADRAAHHREVLATLQAASSDLDRGGFGSEWQAAALRARAYARLNRLDSATLAGQHAVAAVERVRAGFGSSMLRGAYAAEKQQAYSDLVEIFLRQDRTAEALEVADAARSRALLEHLAAVGRDAGGADSTIRTLAEGERLLRLIDSVVSRLDALEAVSPAERDVTSGEQTRVLTSRLVESRSSYEALLVRVAERDASGMALLGGGRLDARQVQGALRPGEAMLEYLAAPTRLTTFVVTRDAVHSISTDVPREELARRVRLARDLLSDPLDAAQRSRQVLSGLFAVLIAPAERAGWLAGTERLLIVPHSVLAYLPFAALQDEHSGRYLMERYALLHLPSAAALSALRAAGNGRSARRSGGQAMAFAPFPASLPGSLHEVRTFRDALSSAKAREGPRATERRLRQALSAGGVVHLATHGVLNSRNPMFSRIELATGEGTPEDDGRLEVHELLALRTDASLVFLSGCETGVGAAWSTQFARGEDYATLAQAFLFSGVGNVVGTLWPIQDDGAAAFAERFYAALGSQPPAEALATAQRQMLKDGRFGSPYHWAAYQVFGSNDLDLPPHIAAGMSVSPN